MGRRTGGQLTQITDMEGGEGLGDNWPKTTDMEGGEGLGDNWPKPRTWEGERDGEQLAKLVDYICGEYLLLACLRR